MAVAVARGLPASAIEDVRRWFGSQQAEEVEGVTVAGERGEEEGEETKGVSSSKGDDATVPAVNEEPLDVRGNNEGGGRQGGDALGAGVKEEEEGGGEEEGARFRGQKVMTRAAIEAVTERNGGGWHGLGWVGQGRWRVQDVEVSREGVCGGCGERLACIDLDERETESFIAAVEKLVADRGKAQELAAFKVRPRCACETRETKALSLACGLIHICPLSSRYPF